MASTFEKGNSSDYYKTSLFLRTNGEATDIYLSNIGFEDSSEKNPISSAIRLGLVVHEAGKNGKVSGEYIFAISNRKIRKQSTIRQRAGKGMFWMLPKMTAYGPFYALHLGGVL